MTAARAATWVALATGFAFGFASGASAQYYPPGPYSGPPNAPVRMGPPMPVEQADDGPDIYAPPPPPNYGPRSPEAMYPGQGPAQGPQRQAMPSPAPGTSFPAPADYPWVRQRGGYPAEQAATGPYDDQPPPQSGHMLPDSGGPRPPSPIGGPNAPVAYPNTAPNTAVASLPADIRPEEGEPAQLPPQFQRQVVSYPSTEPAGTIIIDTPNTYLYLILGNGRAMRYGIGVGREGFTWSGTERISRMSEWPDWHPPKEMIERQPYLPRFMAGGASNPLGARALYLGKTLYRIHGTNQPSTIGSFVSSGCIRLVNNDIEDLYSRVQVGTRVVVLPGANQPPAASATGPTAIR
jgi:lipoprotein-anchoring transpeptidase ErfK/SrfK